MEPSLFGTEDCRVERILRGGATRAVQRVSSPHPSAACTSCGRPSRAVHSRYVRRPADLPRSERAVSLEVLLRRFFCANPACSRRTFAEPWTFLAAHARRTQRLAAAQGAVAATVGAEPGARLLQRLAMRTSPDTLLRLMRRAPLPAAPEPRVVGVDDWAFRKGHHYGAIVVDLERRRPVDLLPDRSAATVAAWLKRHPRVRVIARDRSTELARAAREGAPCARQVADRWHLLHNTREMLERWLTSRHAHLRALPAPARSAPAARRGPFLRTQTEVRAREGSRARRVALYEEIRRRRAAGATIQGLSRSLGVARATVRRYAFAASFPERALRAPAPSQLDPHVPSLVARHRAGCDDAKALWREAQARGFRGSAAHVRRWLRGHRRALASTAATENRGAVASGAPFALPSARRLAWFCLLPRQARTAEQEHALAHIRQDPEVARGVTLAQQFAALVRRRSITHGARPRRDCKAFERWLARARRCPIDALRTFALGLEQDGSAVRAALTTRWSNGQTEGQIHKLKMLKRQMYGRGSLDLLRRRLLLAA